MCGIVGFIRTEEDFDLKTIGHRGPDAYGVYEDDVIKLGHTRLSIQDLSDDANQPFISQCGNYVLIFNGEIYNHVDIRTELSSVSFKTTGDTETVLYSLIQFGVHALEKFNGIFALAFYNKREGKIIVARDRFGVKPLYYGETSSSFVFGSELKSLLSWKKLSVANINLEALENYLRFLYSPGEGTPIKDIRKLLPGHCVEIYTNNETIKTSSFSFLPEAPVHKLKCSEKEIIDKLSSQIELAVERQLLADVPVGFFLSGGLDSSLLVAIARKLRPEMPIQCFTIDTNEFSETEGFKSDLYFAQKVADYLKVDLEIVPSTSKILENLDRVVWHLDEPQADAAPLHVFNIAKCAHSKGFKVLIGGTAGDDLFSGYRRHEALLLIRKFNFIPNFVYQLINCIIQNVRGPHPKIRRLQKVSRSLSEHGLNKIYSLFEWLPFEETSKLFVKKIPGHRRFKFFENQLSTKKLSDFTISDILHLEKSGFLVDHNLNYTDKLGMAAGVEIRVPFLDNDLEMLSRKIPDSLKIKGGETKYILKKVAEKYLPKEVIYREKSGFGAPVRKWVNHDLKNRIDKDLSFEFLQSQGIFDAKSVRNLIERDRLSKIDASYSIWALLSIQSWFKQFLIQHEADHTKFK
jgi:asparagine synthase (glutamine-hydrolysing)